MIAIDPGDKHCGLAVFDHNSCIFTEDLTPLDLADYLEMSVESKDIWIVEDFVLYPWMAQKQGFSQMKTPKTIGVIEHIARRKEIEVVLQPATIKKPTQGIVKACGIVQIGKNVHERDAELHGYQYLFKQNPRLIRKKA